MAKAKAKRLEKITLIEWYKLENVQFADRNCVLHSVIFNTFDWMLALEPKVQDKYFRSDVWCREFDLRHFYGNKLDSKSIL